MSAVGDALALAGSMAWQILWALILGFTLSAVFPGCSLTVRIGSSSTGTPRIRAHWIGTGRSTAYSMPSGGLLGFLCGWPKFGEDRFFGVDPPGHGVWSVLIRVRAGSDALSGVVVFFPGHVRLLETGR